MNYHWKKIDITDSKSDSLCDTGWPLLIVCDVQLQSKRSVQINAITNAIGLSHYCVENA